MRTIELERPDIASLAERERPDPKPPAHGQVRVRTRAASLNFLDLMVARGDYPGIAYPLIPIADAAGEIVALGPDVTGLRIGDRVALHAKPLWIAGPGTAETAQPTRGVTLPGALQEEQLVAAQSVVRAPDHLSWEEIAALPIVATTANNALRSRCETRPVRRGPNSMTVKPNRVTNQPAVATVTPRSRARPGRSPTMMNSVVTMMKAETASRRTASALPAGGLF